MFGGNVTSSWANPNPQQNQQNQQNQQPQTGAFGQPTGFGATAFGSTGAFGQPQQQQQQPQANPMFGNLGGASTSTGNTGFGAFGNTNTTQNSAANPMFGGAKPATGFGAFGGGTNAFGGGGTFGQSTSTAPANTGTTTGLFGQPASNTGGGFGTNTAGTGSSLFGGTKTTTAFGAPAAVTTGSSNPTYAVTNEKDANVTLQYQAISCMPAYVGSSFEELRLQDYAQGRKTAGAFGQSAAFGGVQSQPASTGLFGAQPQQNTQQSSLFGGTTNPTTTTTGFGAFGQTPAANQAPAAPTTNGLFGGGTFGQQPQQQQTQGFGTFGQQQPQQQPQPQQSGGLFGNSAFGSTATKPAFPAFGGGGGSAFGGGGAFGQNTQQQQQPSQPAGGLFGQTQPTTTTGFGAFGNNTANTANKSIFGQTAPTTTQPTQTGFGAFGGQQQNQQAQQPQAQPSSIFGSGTGLFGNNNTQQQPQASQQQTTNPLFGGTPAQPTGSLFGGSLFNNNNNQQQQQQPQAQQQNQFGGLFGKPAAPTTQGLFGSGFGQQQPSNTPAQPQTLFGNSLGSTANQQSTLSGGLFGNKPAAPLLGNSTSAGQGGGLFGSIGANNGSFNASMNNAGAQGSLTASISQPIGANLPIFSMLPSGPRAISLEQSQPKKKAGFFIDIPTRSPVPRVQLGYTPANSKLRGFSSTSLSSSNGNVNNNGLSFSSGKNNVLTLSRVGDNRNSVGPDSFLGRSSSPSLGSGQRHSVKKLILDKKVEPSELFSKSGSSPGSLRGSGKVTFSPALSVAAREKDVAAASSSLNLPIDSPTPAPRPQRASNRFTAQSTQSNVHSDALDESGTGTLEEGDYWVKPDLATLKQAGYDQLSSFQDLVVGRIGYGEIHFLEPVDLTGLSKLGALLGEVIRFDDKECSVYPDSEDVDKPPPGSGLNVRARLSLVRCWAVDKATREPIKDSAHPSAAKHLKRLKNMKDTKFEAFDVATGTWTFVVDHF